MARSIEWDKVTQADVLRAIGEYDRLGDVPTEVVNG